MSEFCFKVIVLVTRSWVNLMPRILQNYLLTSTQNLSLSSFWFTCQSACHSMQQSQHHQHSRKSWCCSCRGVWDQSKLVLNPRCFNAANKCWYHHQSWGAKVSPFWSSKGSFADFRLPRIHVVNESKPVDPAGHEQRPKPVDLAGTEQRYCWNWFSRLPHWEKGQ